MNFGDRVEAMTFAISYLIYDLITAAHEYVRRVRVRRILRNNPDIKELSTLSGIK